VLSNAEPTFVVDAEVPGAGPALHVNLPTGERRWKTTIAYPPFAFELVLAEDWKQPDPLCGIGFHTRPYRTNVP
jgi:hypothetical protein